MQKKAKFITSLSSEEALDFLMQSAQYHNFELPEYFEFDKVLQYVKDTIGEKDYGDCLSDVSASDLCDVNFDILLNKDGKYAVRPLILCNPYLYYFLAREICGKSNWKKIKDNFEKCTVPTIQSCALPVLPEKVEKFHKATAILNWWNSMEQQSIELSLDYRYMFVTDITNCYGSVNPQTLDWALSRKNTTQATDENHQIAANIIRYLRDFQQGRNIGIPQGSTLFDLTGEIILSYSDLFLYEELKKEGIVDGYKILRYRDDYRIFCGDKGLLEKISYKLQQVLEMLNFRMNSSKTFISDSIISDAIKPDKLFYIFNTPIFKKNDSHFDGLQKHLLYIMLFARKFPNAGQLRVMLNNFDERVIDRLKPREKTREKSIVVDGETTKVEEKVMADGWIGENIKAMCAIATQIAIENVAVAHYALRVVSRMIDSLKNECLKDEIISKVCKKLINQPNSTYNKLWLQNMTYHLDKERKNCPYDVRLCKIVMGEDLELWNNSWLKPALRKKFPLSTVVNRETLKTMPQIITFRETQAYLDMFGEEDYLDYSDDWELDGLDY